jgi:hypothetical protein
MKLRTRAYAPVLTASAAVSVAFCSKGEPAPKEPAASNSLVFTSARQVPLVRVRGEVEYDGSTATVPVSNAEAVIRSQIHPGAKRCYQQGLESDPTQSGRLVVVMQVEPSGEVDSASVSSNSGLSASVANCIQKVAGRVKFAAPGASGSSISVPFTFVRQDASEEGSKREPEYWPF